MQAGGSAGDIDPRLNAAFQFLPSRHRIGAEAVQIDIFAARPQRERGNFGELYDSISLDCAAVAKRCQATRRSVVAGGSQRSADHHLVIVQLQRSLQIGELKVLPHYRVDIQFAGCKQPLSVWSMPVIAAVEYHSAGDVLQIDPGVQRAVLSHVDIQILPLANDITFAGQCRRGAVCGRRIARKIDRALQIHQAPSAAID